MSHQTSLPVGVGLGEELFELRVRGVVAPKVADEVDIAAVTEAGVAVDGTSTALASVDPFIRVDPSFPNASQYTTNGATPVDEPGALTILAIGLPVLYSVTLGRRQCERRTDQRAVPR